MTAAVIIVVIVVVAAAIAFALARRTSGGESAGQPTRDVARPSAPYREFHVRGDAALVYFDVPLPEGEPDPVLSDLLVREAVEVLRQKQSHDLPLDDVTIVKAFGTRSGQDVEAGSISLETPGMLPDVDHIEVVPHFSSVPFDPLARLGEQDHGAPAAVADVSAREREEGQALRPLGEELALTGRVDAGLRAQGLDPSTMTAGRGTLGRPPSRGATSAA